MATPSRCAPFMVERAFPILSAVRVWPRDSLVVRGLPHDWHAHWDARGRCWLKTRRHRGALGGAVPPIDMAALSALLAVAAGHSQ
jgi:hypothetical protein